MIEATRKWTGFRPTTKEEKKQKNKNQKREKKKGKGKKKKSQNSQQPGLSDRRCKETFQGSA